MTQTLRFLTLTACLLLVGGQASAAVWTFEGGMSTEQSAATHVLDGLTGFGGGFVIAELDDETGVFEWALGFAGVGSPVGSAGFHGPAFAGAVAPETLATPDLVGTSSGVFFGSAVLDAVAIAELTGGGLFGVGSETPWYHNIETGENPDGELRGQLFVAAIVPLPASAWLLLSSLVAVVGLSRHRRST